MAETPTASASRFGFLARKVGPLPVWAWAAVAVGAWYIYKARTAGISTAAQQQAAATGQQQQPSIIQNLTETVTGPLTGGGTTTPGRKPPPKKKPPKRGKGEKGESETASQQATEDYVKARTGKNYEIGQPWPKGLPRPVDQPPGKRKPTGPPVKGGGVATQTATAGGQGPLLSTVQQAGIVTAPAYLDTSGAYQREPALVQRLTYPVVPSAPGQPPVAPPAATTPPPQPAYAPMTAGSIYQGADIDTTTAAGTTTPGTSLGAGTMPPLESP